MSFTGKTKASSYKDILQMDNSNSGIDATTRVVKDGEGTQSALALSDDQVVITPKDSDGLAILKVTNKSGTAILTVDSTNSHVKVGGNKANTQYAYFNINSGNAGSGTYSAGYHYPLTFSASSFYSSVVVPFGNGTDPATTFTTAEASAERASDLVPLIWYVSDNITIDEIKHLEGADTATGDTTRMHLLSYTFNSGSTSCLTSGAVVANTIFDNTNAGSEHPYLRDWGILTADIDAGKVLLCFFESDTVNSDYAIQVTIKYHLR